MRNLDAEDDENDEVMNILMENVTKSIQYRYGSRNVVPKSNDWVINVLPDYDDNRFMTMLRVNRNQFKIILSEIENDDIFTSMTTGHSRRQFPVYFQLAVVLFRLGGSGESATIKKIAATFGIGDGGTIEKLTFRVFGAILKLRCKFLFWPNENERNLICEETAHELPDCIGYLDGSEIRLAEAPVKHALDYFSRKHQYSVKVQLICDYKKSIRYVTVGYPGSVHDARIFNECALARNSAMFLTGSQWIAADSAYKLTPQIITPYRKNSREVPNNQKTQFNKYFSKYRVRIEHTFGLAKEKFGSLKEFRMRLHNNDSHKFMCNWILVCCILYNIILPTLDDDEIIDLDDQIEDENVDENLYDMNDAYRLAEEKRKYIYNNYVLNNN